MYQHGRWESALLAWMSVCIGVVKNHGSKDEKLSNWALY